jgi:hypothetical protein
MQNEKTKLSFHCMNTTLPGYQIVFVDNPPKKPKPMESFYWVLKLPADEFPSKDSLPSQEIQSAQDIHAQGMQTIQTQPLSEFCFSREETQAPKPLFPFTSCLLEMADFERELDESQLPEAELLEDELVESVELQPEVKKAPPLPLSLKPKPRSSRTAPEFVSNTHEYSGPLLGEVRCFHGITLGELANATRVAQHHLQNIEREQYDRLPATVYLRGYLKSVARELGLDVQLVSQSYLDRMQQAKS